ncbi:MAG: hypothetical protein U1E30_12725 [Rhodoblastus sp.]
MRKSKSEYSGPLAEPIRIKRPIDEVARQFVSSEWDRKMLLLAEHYGTPPPPHPVMGLKYTRPTPTRDPLAWKLAFQHVPGFKVRIGPGRRREKTDEWLAFVGGLLDRTGLSKAQLAKVLAVMDVLSEERRAPRKRGSLALKKAVARRKKRHQDDFSKIQPKRTAITDNGD